MQIRTCPVFKTSRKFAEFKGDRIELDTFKPMPIFTEPYDIKPQLFRLAIPAEKRAFESARLQYVEAEVVDTLEEQLVEWLIIQHPKLKGQPERLATEIRKAVGPKGWDHFGVWAWFPWRKVWVRLLDEMAFVDVRTNRNQLKISKAEQAMLAEKRVGVVGLSVGSALAMTLAMERTCGGLKLADFDDLELSNLNRIQTGVHHLGMPKSVVLARAIAEVDPFFEVELVREGFTNDNAEDFFDRLDVVVDACDQVQAKANLRWHAKAHRIPLIMETSDRGMLDVERYDLPDTAFLHGRISEELLAEMRTAAGWIPAYFDAFIDVAQASERGRLSLLAVGESLVGWPQLYSDVAGGGAHAAHAIRKVLLGESVADARHYLEWDEQLVESVH